MCNHRYTSNYANSPRSMGQRCPYSELYDGRWALPLDERGACIFHSQEIAWKYANTFQEHFLGLVKILDEYDAQSYYDFAEFVFVGNQTPAEGGSDQKIFRIEGAVFRKFAYFTAASFRDVLMFDRVEFQGGAAFNRAMFARDLNIEHATIRGLDLCDARMAGPVSFVKVQFLDHALFNDAYFSAIKSGVAVKFEECRFEGITDFSGAAFTGGDESTVAFWRVQFEDFTNFQRTRFRCHLEFDEVSFGHVTEFIDTSFESIGSTARYRGAAVEFNRIAVPSDAVLTFKSTDTQSMMFTHDVQMSFKEDPTGVIRFDHVNFSKITSPSRLRLMRLSKSGNVEIGAGCIKYRFQTVLRTVAVNEGNFPLVVELCQTFTNYFTRSNGLNLGFEIVDRSKTGITFFYFTDEDISEAMFLERLTQSEKQLWDLLSVRTDRQLLGVEDRKHPLTKESVVINAVDGISALMGTFFRVGARIAMGVWKAADTRALLTAIRFNDDGAEDRAASLHRVIVEKYTGQTLFGINRQQNELLLPMVMDNSDRPAFEKTRILFLGANSLENPLALDQEVKQIQRNLKLAPERDELEFRQEWAVTVDTLSQAMLEQSPTIVHFAGHGLETGIILQDELGRDKVVSAEALAKLFELFRDTVRCVVLSACFSERQARAIRLHIPHVIGMSEQMPDSAAIAFSTGFYQAIGAGRDIPFAFAFGIAKIGLEGVFGGNALGDNIPVLL